MYGHTDTVETLISKVQEINVSLKKPSTNTLLHLKVTYMVTGVLIVLN